MGTYTFTSKRAMSLNVDGKPVNLAPNKPYTTDDACKTVSLVLAWQQKMKSLGENPDFAEGQEGLFNDALTTCIGEMLPDLQNVAPPDAPAEDTNVGLGLGDGLPGPSGDTAASVGAPTPDPNGGLDGSRTPTDQSNAPPGSQRHDRSDPRSLDDIANDALNQGKSPEQAQQTAEDARRNEPVEGKRHQDFSDNRRETPAESSDPVALFSGEFTLDLVDVEIASPGFPIRLERLYRSGRVFYGPWGFQWDHNYNVHLRPLANGDAAVWTGRLSEDVFVLQPDGSYTPPVGVFRRLLQDVAMPAPVERWTLTERYGRTFEFSRPAGWPFGDRLPLTGIADRNGNRQDLTYDVEGRLAEVGDGSGRRLIFTYGGCGLLEKIEDHTGRRWLYFHDDGIEHLVAVASPATDEFPDGRIQRYEYDRFRPHPLLQHTMIAVVDGDGRIAVENTYGDDPSSDDFGRVIRQESDGGVSEFSAERLQYVPRIPDAINVPAIRVNVLDPGFLYVYTFNYRGDLLDRRHRLVVDGSYRLVADTYRYDQRGNLVSQYDADGRGMVYDYDTANPDPRAQGNLLLAKRLASPLKPGPALEVLRATYEPRFFQLKSYKDGLGAITTLVYDFEVAPGGVGDLMELRRPPFTQPDGTAVTPVEGFTYNARGQLLQHDENGEIHAFAYEAAGIQQGFLIETSHSRAGVTVIEGYVRDDLGNIVRKTDGLGHHTDYTLDAFNLVRKVTRPDGVASTFGYDGAGRMRSMLEPRGDYDDLVLAGAPIRHEFEYTASGFLSREIFGANTAAPRAFTYERSAEGRIVRETDPVGRQITRRLDERGLIITEESRDPSRVLLQKRVFRYGRTGELLAVRVEGGPEVRLDYDGYARLREATDPDGTTYLLRRNAAGLVTRVQVRGRTGDNLSAVGLLAEQTVEYNEAGLLRGRSDSVFDYLGGPADAYASRFWLDPTGRLARQDSPAGLSNDYTYGPLGLLLHRADSLGNGDDYQYDAVGRAISHTITEVSTTGAALSFPFTLAYDLAGRVIQESGPLGETVNYQYDERNAMVGATNPLGSLLTLRHNAFGELLSQQLGANQIAWERDAVGRVTRLVDPTGTATRFEYDVLAHLLRVIHPDGNTQRYEYRADGALTRFVDYDGTAVAYDLTASGLPSRIATAAAPGVAATPDLRYEYDGLRRIARADYGPAISRRAYDSLGRLRREDLGPPVTVTYGNGGKDWELAYPDGRLETRTHDSLGRLRSITLAAGGTLPLGIAPGTTLLDLDWAGETRPLTADLSGQAICDWSYDAGGRLAALAARNGGGSVFRQRLYRDRLGLVRAMDTDAGLPDRRVTTSDELQRLLDVRYDFAPGILPADPSTATQGAVDAGIAAAQAAPPTALTRFLWSPADTPDRREERDGAGVLLSATDYTTNALHQIDTLDGAALGYDGRGDIVVMPGRTLTYDGFRRLVEVAAGGASLIKLGYDPFGRLGTVEQNGTITTFRYLGDDLIESSRGGAVVEQRTPGIRIDNPAAVHGALGTLFPVYDVTGSVVALIDSAGAVVERYRYDVFGSPEIRSPDGTLVLPVSAVGFAPAYHGRPYLEAVGFYDFRSRIYAPILLGFLQPDPIAFSASWSYYGFARYNPYCFTDPNGTWVHLLVGAIIGAAIGGIGTAISGGDGWDILVGIGAGAIGGALTAAGNPIAGAAIAGGIMGAWSGGRIGYQMGGGKGAVIGAVGGGVAGAALGAFTGAVGSRIGGAVGTRVYGTVFNAAVNRGVTATTATTMARGSSMVAGGYVGGASAGILGNTASTVGVDLATGQPITASQLGTAVRDGVTRDGALGAVGASAERYALVARIPGMTGNRWGTIPGRANTGLEGEILVGKAIGVEPSRGADTVVANGRTRKPDFPLNQTIAEDGSGNPLQNVVEVKNKASLSTSGNRSDVAQIRDFAAVAAAGGGDVLLYHRPGMDTTPLAGIQNIVMLPIPQQPFVLPLPYGLTPQRQPGQGSK